MRLRHVLVVLVAATLLLPVGASAKVHGQSGSHPTVGRLSLLRGRSVAQSAPCPSPPLPASDCAVNPQTGCPEAGPIAATPPLSCVPLRATLVDLVTTAGGRCVENEYLQVQLIPGLVSYEAVWYWYSGFDGSRWWSSPGTTWPDSVIGEGGDSYPVPKGYAAWSAGGGSAPAGGCNGPPPGTLGYAGWGITEGGTISGKIATPFGDGLGGATVKLSGSASATTTTAADGSYAFTDLAAGTYTVTPVVPSGWGPDEYTPTECDDGAAGIGSCVSMSLGSDQADNANFTAAYKLTGNVTGLDGKSMEGATVQIKDTEQGVTQTATATTNASGDFTSKLAPGSVVASVEPVSSASGTTTFAALSSPDCTASGDACQVDQNRDRSVAFCALAAQEGSDRAEAVDFAQSQVASHTCPLFVDAQPFDGAGTSYGNYQSALGQNNYYPAVGFSYDGSTVPRFLTGVSDPGQSDTIDGTAVEFQPACLSGCSDIAVHVTQGTGDPSKSPPEANATVTASIFDATATLPIAFEPSGDTGVICALTPQSSVLATLLHPSGCATSGVTVKTDQDGNALFRYFPPGVVNPDTGTGSVSPLAPPQVKLRFTASGPLFSCGCGEAFGSTGTTNDPDLRLDPWFRLWLNKDATVTPGEIRALNALLEKNKGEKEDREDQAKEFLKLLKKYSHLDDKTIDGLKGLSDLALSDYVDELMRRTPELVELDWFMSKFGIASEGLLNYNLDLAEWGQEIKQPLVELLSGKFDKYLGAATGGLDKKLEKYKKLKAKVDELKKKLNKLFKDEVTVALDKAFGKSFLNQVFTIVDQIRKIGGQRPRTKGHASLKLYDVSTCSDQCLTGLPAQKLFMLFSYKNAGLTYFYPGSAEDGTPYGDETPIGFNAAYWLKAQCNSPYHCGAKLQ